MSPSSLNRYPLALRLLHWLLAALMLSTLLLGWWLEDIDGLMFWHRSLGLLALLFALLRLACRWHSRKQLPPSLNPPGSLARKAEQTVHGLLYLSMLLLPLLGWMKTSASGHEASFFGLFTLPALLPHVRWLSRALGEAHSLAASAFVILLTLHVLGAVMHAVLHQNNPLRRISLYPAHFRSK